MKRHVIALGLAVWVAGAALAVPPAVTPPAALPATLADIGGPTPVDTNGQVCPFIILGSGQSNMLGQDHNGDHTIQSGISITNSMQTATAIVPAVYGTAPLNSGYGGTPGTSITTTTSNPTLSYTNQIISFANAERLYLTSIGSSRPILVAVIASGNQSIIDWINPSTAPTDIAAQVRAQWSVINTAHPGCIINAVVWDQGEKDNGGTSYSTQATYGAAFTGATYQGAAFTDVIGVVPLFQSLSGWSAQTRWINVPMGQWNDANGQPRNDFFLSTANGGLYPFMTLVSNAGTYESPDNPIPHYRGDSQVLLGQREFAAYQQGRVLGSYAAATNTYNGSTQVFPIVPVVPATTSLTGSISGFTLTVSAESAGSLLPGYILIGATYPTVVTQQLTGTTGSTGTYLVNVTQTVSSTAMTAGPALGVDDIKSGATITANGTFQLPIASASPNATILINTLNAATSKISLYSASPVVLENSGTIAYGVAAPLYNASIYQATAANGNWYVTSLSTRYGNQRLCYSNALAGGSVTLPFAQLNHCSYTLSGETVTVTPTFGSESEFTDITSNSTITSSYSFIMPNGSTQTTITLQPGETVKLSGAVGTASALINDVVSDTFAPIPVTGIATAGTTLATATRLAANDNTLATCSTGAVSLPTTTPVGGSVLVRNRAGAACSVYPDTSSDQIEALGAGVVSSQASGVDVTYVRTTATLWRN